MLEAGCIDTGVTALELPCTTPETIQAAQADIAAVASREFQAPNIVAKYPHWVVYVQQQLEALTDLALSEPVRPARGQQFVRNPRALLALVRV